MRAVMWWGVLAVALTVLVGCASSKPESAGITVSGGDTLRIEVGGAWVRDLLEETLDTEIACDGGVDGELEQMLLSLERRGRRGSAVLRGDDGVIHARRRGSLLKLDVRGDDGGRVRLTVPWALADCLLGRSNRLGDALERVEVRLDGADGTVVRLSLGD